MQSRIFHDRTLVPRSAAILLTIALFWALIMFSTAEALIESRENDAVVLEDVTNYEIRGEADAEMTRHVKIKVLRESGSDFGDITLGESSFDKLDDFTGRVYDASGRLVYEYGKKDGDRFCGFSGYSLYEDVCVYDYVLSTSSYPFTIEYDYREKHKSLFFWPEWLPQDIVPVTRTSYTLTVPADFEFKMKTIGEIPDPVITEEGGKKTYRWELENLPALKWKVCSVPYADDKPRLMFAPEKFKLDKHNFVGRSWSTLGRYYQQMTSDCFQLNGEQKELLDRLRSYEIGDRAICDSLHDYLQRRSRYVAIEVGIGGWMPSKAKDTFERGYGDCKDLSTMYVAMLRYLGIQSGLILIRSKNYGNSYPDFLTLDRFNHVIIYSIIDGDTVWTDPTCEVCQFGDLPYLDENAYVLAMDSVESRVLLTPSSTPSDNVIWRTATVKAISDRTLGVELRFATTGNAHQRLQADLSYSKRHEWEDIFKSDFFGVSDKFNMDSIVVDDQDMRADTTVATLYGKVSNAIHSVGPKQFIDITFLSCLCRAEEIDLDGREQDVYLYYPRTYIDSLVLSIPDGYRVPELPPDSSINGPFVQVSVASAVDPSRLIITRQKQFKSYFVKQSELLQFQIAIDREKECVPTHIALVKE